MCRSYFSFPLSSNELHVVSFAGWENCIISLVDVRFTSHTIAVSVSVLAFFGVLVGVWGMPVIGVSVRPN